MRFSFLDAKKAEFPVARLCETLEVSQSGYFAWKSRPASERQCEDMVLLAHIHERFHLSRETYGSLDLADYRNVVQDQRYLELHDEIADLDSMIGAIVDELAPSLVARNSIGHGAAAQLLLTAGDNVQRLQSEAGFAALCGVSPVPASPLAGFGPIREPRLTWRNVSPRPFLYCGPVLRHPAALV
jgi:hypothetical protein